MSELSPPKRPDAFTTLEVYRWVENGAESTIDSVRGLSANILGHETTGQVPLVGEKKYLEVGHPYCKVKDASDLRLEMYMRMDETSSNNRPQSRFTVLKKKLIQKEQYTAKQKKLHAQFEPRIPLKEGLERIQLLEFGLSDPLELDITGIGVRFSGDIRNGSYELVFLPTIASKVGKMLMAQAKYTQGRVIRESARVGYPTNYESLGIPFASIREVPESRLHAEQKLHTAITGLLPFTVTLGQVELK